MALSAWQATIVNESGDVIPSASIEVVDEATGLTATIFANSGGGSLGNPFSAGTNGFARFYADAGSYTITASDAGSGFSESFNNVRLGNAQGYDVGAGATDVPTNANLSASIAGTATFSGDVYTFTPVGTGFRPLQAGMYLSFRLPSGSTNTTTTPDINYNGTTYVIKWINGSALAANDLSQAYNKQPIMFYFDGTDMLIASDISGSNANGKWTKKASGTINMCIKKDKSITTTNVGQVVVATLTLAKPILSIDEGCILTTLSGLNADWTDGNERGKLTVCGRFTSTSTADVLIFRIISGVATSGAVYVDISARWY